MVILFLVGGLLCLVLVVALFVPSRFVVEKGVVFAEKASTLFAYVNDLEKFNQWSPWARLNADCHFEFSNPAEGLGSTLSWCGKRDKGMLTIDESIMHKKVVYSLSFKKPFKGEAKQLFTFDDDGNQTYFTWVMEGKRHYMMKVFWFFYNFERVIEQQLGEGISLLKAQIAHDQCCHDDKKV